MWPMSSKRCFAEGIRMKCTNCKTEVESEATDRGICYDCYCQLDLQDYEAHLQASLLEEE